MSRVEVIGNATLYLGDCLEVLRTLPDNSVDSVVTDPPYGLKFMGKKWDHDVPPVEVWAECLRVLKPGGHLLAFAGTRTQHRMACRIEDAGFEIRDMIAWVYGSGFPKSMDVAAAIDKLDATEARRARQLRFTEWVRGTGLTSARIDELTGTNMGGHYTTAASQPAVATREHFERLRPYVGPVPAWVETLVDERTVESENFKAREVLGVKSVGVKNGAAGGSHEYGLKATEVQVTAPATPEARQWQGWGTALKPALEPITMARKPLVGTVAANVLEHGTGAINVDGCRVDGGPIASAGGTRRSGGIMGTSEPLGGWELAHTGRWPANLIHDGSEEVLAGFPNVKGGTAVRSNSGGNTFGGETPKPPMPDLGYNDTGSAARFFYCAKASKSDRNSGAGNTHPTVKPTNLMRYLCRLVTPAGGTVLDPYMGSGSTGVACHQTQRAFIGIEREPKYFDIACRRIEDAQRQGRLIT